ncbi:MAG: hypothetical protein BWY35_01147 [Firmicutes bacterium ADurb.Bin248]|nr:MAG: hypothetical protein BWY35_01147 [Firmicutes bacterium ADurb.Bin248]HOG01550.1 hypothetical protein [Clostridia bacterium]HPK14599.1 hypothetical protein [Clostridia bacterium]
MNTNVADMHRYLEKWQSILRLMDWDIKLRPVEKEWRKSGDIKIDTDDRTAVLLVNVCNPRQTNLEELIVHELLHLKLWGMDQMIETLMNCVYGEDESDKKREFAYTQFMTLLESTVNDLAKSFLQQAGEDREISFGRLEKEVREEIGG